MLLKTKGIASQSNFLNFDEFNVLCALKFALDPDTGSGSGFKGIQVLILI